MSNVWETKVIKDGMGKRIVRTIAAAMLGPAILIGAASCSKSTEEYKPKTAISRSVEAPSFVYADDSRFILSGDKFVPKDDSTSIKIVKGILGDGDPLDFAKVGPILRSTWDKLIETQGQGFLMRIDDALFVRDPSAATKNDIVSESVYWLSIAGRAHNFGVSTLESQAMFDGLLNGVDQMTALARANGSKGVFPAWAVTIDDHGKLALNTDKDKYGAMNSASDADQDLLMGLLIAIDNVKKGIWEDRGYAVRLDQLIDSAAKEYTLIAGTYVLQPSEDYAATEKEHDFRLDYHSPETCFALAQYLEDKGDTARAAQWKRFGHDSVKVYLTALESCNRIPSKAWVYAQDGKLTITPYGTQGFDGIRGPERLAGALRYIQLNPQQQEIVKNYLARWSEVYTVPGLDAAVYLPLAIALDDQPTAERIAKTLSLEMGSDFIYKDTSRYFQSSLMMKSLLEVLYPYNIKVMQETSHLNHDPSRLAVLQALTPAEVYDVNNGYFGKTADGFGFVINNNPLPDLQEILPPGNFVINSESMAYGLIKATADHDWAKVDALLKTIYYFSQKNYEETSQTLKLLPWAVFYNGKNFSIVQKGGIPNYGNASASDADQFLLMAMMWIVQSGHGGSELRNFISLYTDHFIQYDVAKYSDASGNTHFLLKSGGLVEPAYDEKTGDSIYEYHTSYPNYQFLQYLAQYFQNDQVYNTSGSAYRYAVFSQLLLDTKALMGKIIEKFPAGKDFPEVVYVRAQRVGGLDLVLGEKNYEPVPSPEASWRLPMNIGYDPNGYFSQSLEKALAADAQNTSLENPEEIGRHDYYKYYVSEMAKIAYPTEAPRFSIDDTIYHNGIFEQMQNLVFKHYKLGPLSAFYDQRYDRSVTAPDNSQISPNLVGYYQSKSTGYDYLRLFLQYACELANGRDTAYQAVAVYEDTLVKYMLKQDMRSVYVSVVTSNSIFTSDMNIVDQYFTILRSMFGYDNKHIIDKLDTLLGIATNYGASADNAVVRELQFQKLLFWDDLSPVQKAHVSSVVKQYHWDSLLAYLQNRPTRQDELKQIKIEWESYSGDTAIDTATMTVDQFVHANIPTQLKNIIVSEITKRDVLGILADFSAQKISAAELQSRLERYVNGLPEEYRLQGLVPILYMDGHLDGQGVRSADPIPRDVKDYFIRTSLEKLKRPEKGKETTYLNMYSTIWSAYKLLLYKDISDDVKQLKLSGKPVTGANSLRLTKNLIAFIQMTDVIQQTGINVDLKGLPAVDQKVGDMIALFKAKFMDDVFVKTRQSFGFMDTMADIMNNLYWLGYDLGRIAKNNPGIPSAYVELYDQLKPAVYDGKQSSNSQSMIELYKLQRTDWKNNQKLLGTILRIALQETATTENILQKITVLRNAQQKAKIYNQNEEYAYFLVSEAYIYAMVPSKDIDGYARFLAIKNDPILKKYDYLSSTVQDMEVYVKDNYQVKKDYYSGFKWE